MFRLVTIPTVTSRGSNIPLHFYRGGTPLLLYEIFNLMFLKNKGILNNKPQYLLFEIKYKILF
jgi:hypothetical protein